eukprot:jgi/Mesen1/4933/ME000246S04156
MKTAYEGQALQLWYCGFRLCRSTFAIFVSCCLLLGGVSGQALVSQYRLALYGANQVGHPGDPVGRGYANVTLDMGTGSATFIFSIAITGTPTSTTINFGEATQDGPEVLELLGRRVAVASPFPGVYTYSGVVACHVELMMAIVSSPNNYHVQVESSVYLNGAIRSQLEYPDSGIRISYTDSAVLP